MKRINFKRTLSIILSIVMLLSTTSVVIAENAHAGYTGMLPLATFDEKANVDASTWGTNAEWDSGAAVVDSTAGKILSNCDMPSKVVLQMDINLNGVQWSSGNLGINSFNVNVFRFKGNGTGKTTKLDIGNLYKVGSTTEISYSLIESITVDNDKWYTYRVAIDTANSTWDFYLGPQNGELEKICRVIGDGGEGVAFIKGGEVHAKSTTFKKSYAIQFAWPTFTSDTKAIKIDNVSVDSYVDLYTAINGCDTVAEVEDNLDWYADKGLYTYPTGYATYKTEVLQAVLDATLTSDANINEVASAEIAKYVYTPCVTTETVSGGNTVEEGKNVTSNLTTAAKGNVQIIFDAKAENGKGLARLNVTDASDGFVRFVSICDNAVKNEIDGSYAVLKELTPGQTYSYKVKLNTNTGAYSIYCKQQGNNTWEKLIDATLESNIYSESGVSGFILGRPDSTNDGATETVTWEDIQVASYSDELYVLVNKQQSANTVIAAIKEYSDNDLYNLPYTWGVMSEDDKTAAGTALLAATLTSNNDIEAIVNTMMLGITTTMYDDASDPTEALANAKTITIGANKDKSIGTTVVLAFFQGKKLLGVKFDILDADYNLTNVSIPTGTDEIAIMNVDNFAHLMPLTEKIVID